MTTFDRYTRPECAYDSSTVAFTSSWLQSRIEMRFYPLAVIALFGGNVVVTAAPQNMERYVFGRIDINYSELTFS